MLTIACGLSERDVDTLAGTLGRRVVLLPDVAAVLRSLHLVAHEALVILGAALPHEQVLRFAADLRATRPATVVVLLRASVNRLDRELGRRAGIDAILPAGDLAEVGRGCQEFLAARSAGGRGFIATVFAGKGGCGKTTIAVNLAAALAREPGRRVCLVDLDLRFGDVAVTLGLQPRSTIASGTQDDADGVPAMVTPFRPGLDCVLAPVRPGEAERLEAQDLAVPLDALTRRYDVVVVDTPGTFSRPVVSALDRSEHQVLVTTPERPALHSLRRTLDTLDLLGHRRDSRSVVFNRSDSRVGITAEDAERALRTPVAARIPSSRDVATSINSCLPLMVSSPDHPVSRAIRRFAAARLLSPAAAPLPSGGAMT